MIELDIEIPEEYEETKEFRPPERKEPYLGPLGEVYTNDFATSQPQIILRKKVDIFAEAKEYLRTVFKVGTWFAKDEVDYEYSGWYAYDAKPEFDDVGWEEEDANVTGINDNMLVFEFPEVEPENSLFQI